MEKKNAVKIFFPSPLAGEDARRAGEGERRNTLFSPLIGFECIRTQNHFPRKGGSHTTNGFTLIELLVVVLIIGILAAVALPQYTLAVNKSRFANLRTIAQSYIKATQAYHLANGEWPKEMDELSIDYPAGMTPVTLPGDQQGSCAQNNEIYCCISKQGSGLCDSVVCGRKDYSFAFQYNNQCSINPNIPTCLAKSSDTNAVKLCRSFGAFLGNTWGLITPEGAKFGYTYYKIEL